MGINARDCQVQMTNISARKICDVKIIVNNILITLFIYNAFSTGASIAKVFNLWSLRESPKQSDLCNTD